MESEIKEVAASDGRRITLDANTPLEVCEICGRGKDRNASLEFCGGCGAPKGWVKADERGVKASDEKRITLELNNTITNDPCAICGARCDPDGFDFLMGGLSLVCTDCAKKNAPDLWIIYRDAHRWREGDTKEVWHEAREAGKREAGRIILDAIEETPVDRVRRICRDELGVEEDVPF